MSMVDAFESFTETGIRQLLRRSPKAVYAVDYVGAWFVNECPSLLTSPITEMIIISLHLSGFPRSMKAVIISH